MRVRLNVTLLSERDERAAMLLAGRVFGQNWRYWNRNPRGEVFWEGEVLEILVPTIKDFLKAGCAASIPVQYVIRNPPYNRATIIVVE